MKVKVIYGDGKERDYINVSSVNDCNPYSNDSSILVVGGDAGVRTVWKGDLLALEIRK